MISNLKFNITKRISRSNEFDITRILLAIVVVFQHCSKLLNTPEILNFNSIPAVPIFIFLSGFLVSESFLFSKSLKIYFEKRIRRILPAYTFVVILGGLAVYLKNIFFENIDLVNVYSLFKYYFFNLLFLNFKYPCIQSIENIRDVNLCAVNGSLWTIKFEILFYLLLPIILSFGNISKNFFTFLLISNFIVLFFKSYISVNFFIFSCFLTGTCLYVIKNKWENIYQNHKIDSYLRFLLVIVLLILSGGFIPFFIVLPLLLLISLFPTKNKAKDLKIFKYGDLSYGIYLVHFPIIRIINWEQDFLNLPSFFLPFLVLIFSSISAFIIYWKLEKRFILKRSL